MKRNCKTCRYDGLTADDEPCKECLDTFLEVDETDNGLVWTLSKWESKQNIGGKKMPKLKNRLKKVERIVHLERYFREVCPKVDRDRRYYEITVKTALKYAPGKKMVTEVYDVVAEKEGITRGGLMSAIEMCKVKTSYYNKTNGDFIRDLYVISNGGCW